MTTLDMPKAGAGAWPAEFDALAAAPENHQLLYEDDWIRVISVSVKPGETERPHHHRWPSVFVIDRLCKLRDFDGDGHEIPLPVPPEYELPLTINMPPQPMHFVRNEDTVGFHGTRVEFKKGFAG